MPDSFKYRLKKLPVTNKLVLLGSVVVFLSVFMPWYQDIDKFNTGEMFLGISGPMYLAGLFVLLASGASAGYIFLKLFEKPLPKLPVSESYLHLFTSAFSLLMLVLTASTYFHSKFGVNLTEKSAGIGMILAFIGVAFVFAGAFIAIKKRDVNFGSEGKIDPLIEISNEDRMKGRVFQKPLSPKESSEIREAVQGSIDDFTSGQKKEDVIDIR